MFIRDGVWANPTMATSRPAEKFEVVTGTSDVLGVAGGVGVFFAVGSPPLDVLEAGGQVVVVHPHRLHPHAGVDLLSLIHISEPTRPY